MEIKPKFKPDPRLKLMEQVHEVLRYHHYAYRTEKSYCDWIVRYIKFHGARVHPRDMGKAEVEAFLSHLAAHHRVSASTQRQALNALAFLYHRVLDKPLGKGIGAVRTRRRPSLPVVLTREEVKRVFAQMSGLHLLMARLLYGSGMRLMECIRLRVKDLDFEHRRIYVYAAKGNKDRTTILPAMLADELEEQVEKVRRLHHADLSDGHGSVYIPAALAHRYRNAQREFRWQYLFPAKKLSRDPRAGVLRRHHVLESGLQKAVKRAVNRAGIVKRVSCQTFRHCFATHMLENGVNIRVVQELMGHADVKTTEIYTHVMQKDMDAVQSPLDTLESRGRSSQNDAQR